MSGVTPRLMQSLYSIWGICDDCDDMREDNGEAHEREANTLPEPVAPTTMVTGSLATMRMISSRCARMGSSACSAVKGGRAEKQKNRPYACALGRCLKWELRWIP